MKVKRLLLGESESIVMTGMPAASAASMASRISSGSAADTRMPAGGICPCTAARSASFSAFGSYVSGPTISTLTPSSRDAARKPSAASCQYAIFVLAATRKYFSVVSCRPPPQAHNRDIATAARATDVLPTMCIFRFLRTPFGSIRPPIAALQCRGSGGGRRRTPRRGTKGAKGLLVWKHLSTKSTEEPGPDDSASPQRNRMPGTDREAGAVAVGASGTPAGRFRWTICALLFFATTVNYADRQILGILAPTLQREIGWSEAEYGLIVTAFQGAYAIGLLGMGRFIDRVGTRLGYSLALGWWSIAAMLHALAASAMGFGCARFLLGLGEAGNFPAAIKTVAEWFPKRERALATGVFNAGS